jgi:hypothetical protein
MYSEKTIAKSLRILFSRPGSGRGSGSTASDGAGKSAAC